MSLAIDGEGSFVCRYLQTVASVCNLCILPKKVLALGEVACMPVVIQSNE
jgi:hypothetical protein